MLAPLPTAEWTLERAGHLLNRAGFGGTPIEIQALHKLGLHRAVEVLLEGDAKGDIPDPDVRPVDQVARREEIRALTADERMERQREYRKEERQMLMDAIGWWLDRMRSGNDPLREKLTLFWHGHFATSSEKVKQPYLLYQQNRTLREHALGNFGDLVKAITRDPAMMVWLDTARSNRKNPNENFGRELLELFTLGIGNYTEDDIKAASRAFTGYRVDGRTQDFVYREEQHDDGEKTFLGKTTAFDGDGIVDRILEQKACSELIARKLWSFFAYENPSPELVGRLAFSLRGSKYEIRPFMRTLLRSREFYSARAVRTQIKGPIQWVIQTARQLEAPLPRIPRMFQALQQLGQVPFMPPNVKGWDGGRAWITTSNLLFRYNLAGYVTGTAAAPMGGKRGRMERQNARRRWVNASLVDAAALVPAGLRVERDALVESLKFRLFQDPLTPNETEHFRAFIDAKGPELSDDEIRELLHLMMSTPQFQLT